MRILDVGCGRGHIINGVLAEKSDCVGIDILPWFKSYLKNAPSNCGFLLCDVQHLCFKNRSFDEVHCYDVLEHVQDSEQALNQIARVLKPGGKLFISVPHPRSERICKFLEPTYYSPEMHLRMFSVPLLENLLETRGLKIIELKNKDFFSAIALTYRLMRKMPFEKQSGYTLKKDTLLLILQLFPCLANPSSWSQLKHELNKRHLLNLYYPLLRFARLIRLIEIHMSHIYPKTIYIEAVKI